MTHGVTFHGKIRGMEKIKRTSAGVKFESDVLDFVDHLAQHQQRSRSFIINTVVRWYAKTLAEQQKVAANTPEPIIEA